MKTLLCLTALSLLACGSADFASAGKPTTDLAHPEAGADNDPMGTGGSDNGSAGKLTAGKAGAPMGGTDSVGSSGAPDDLPMAGTSMGGNAGMATAGKGSASDGGMADMPSAGTSNAGSPNAGTGTGGSGSPMAGTGGTDSAGTGGTTPIIDECSPEGRVGNWTAPSWNWSVGNTNVCVAQMKRIGKSVLDLSTPANCTWQDPPTGCWDGCAFTSTLVCNATPGNPAFTMQVRDTVTKGHLSGTIFYKTETAGNCLDLATQAPNGSMSFSADRF